jgi:hypothetical protein
MKLSLKQIGSLDPTTNTMTSNVYLSAYWYDSRLSWNSSFFGNTTIIIIQANRLWLPDLAVLNIADGTSGFITINDSNQAYINHQGLVYVIFGLSGIKTRCSLNAYYYPYDRQNCSIVIGSWQHDASRINFTSKDSFVDLSTIVKSPMWNLSRVDVYPNYNSKRFLLSNLNYENGKDFMSADIGFFLIMQRGSMFSMINNIFPCLVLNVVILSAFFIPVIVPQMAISITCFLTYGVYSLRVATDLPVQSQYFPVISYYFLFSLFYTLISMIWFVMANYYMTKNKTPFLLDKLADLLSKICCWKMPAPVASPPKLEQSNELTNSHKCSKCEECSFCFIKKDTEAKKSAKKSKNDFKIKVLNEFIFILMVLAFFTTDLVIFLIIAYN